MFVTGGRPAIHATHHDPSRLKHETDYRHCDANILQRASAFAKMRHNQNYQRNSVTPEGPR